MDHPFRTAAVGGFNRQDVLTYLETVNREAAEKQAQLEAQLDEACKANEEQAEELARLREQSEQLEQENGELRERMEDRDRELTELRSRQETASGDAETLRAENARLLEQVEALRPGAEAYDSIKERTAGLELEAHHRAKLVEQEAGEQAEKLHREMEDWAKKVEREYSALRAQVETTVADAAQRLSRAGENLEQVNRLLDQQELELEGLLDAYGKTAEEKPDGVSGVDRLLSEIAGNAAPQSEN